MHDYCVTPSPYANLPWIDLELMYGVLVVFQYPRVYRDPTSCARSHRLETTTNGICFFLEFVSPRLAGEKLGRYLHGFSFRSTASVRVDSRIPIPGYQAILHAVDRVAVLEVHLCNGGHALMKPYNVSR